MIPVEHVFYGDHDQPSLRVWFPAVRAGSGGDVFVERIARSLALRGVATTISWFPHMAEFVPDVLRVIAAPGKFDIVHVNSVNGFAFKKKGVPLVVTEHHYLLDPAYRRYKSSLQQVYHKLLMGPYTDRSFDAADVILTGSQFTANVLKRWAGRNAQVIPYWVDYDVFSPEVHSVPDSDESPFCLLFVGNMSSRKGGDVIATLAERLGDGFRILCTAGMRQKKVGSLPPNVGVLGRLDEADLVGEYRRCDAVLVPSRYEGFGYSALEALACGKPVVGFRSGAIEELVKNGDDALLVDVDDVEGLAGACRRLSSDRNLCRSMGVLGRGRVLDLYNEGRAVDAYIKLYKTLLSK